MAEQKVNTSKSMNTSNVSDKDLQDQINKLGGDLAKEKKVKVSIPTALQKYVGPTVYFGLNGAGIVIPVDGKQHEIPESYKPQFDRWIASVKA